MKVRSCVLAAVFGIVLVALAQEPLRADGLTIDSITQTAGPETVSNQTVYVYTINVSLAAGSELLNGDGFSISDLVGYEGLVPQIGPADLGITHEDVTADPDNDEWTVTDPYAGVGVDIDLSPDVTRSGPLADFPAASFFDIFTDISLEPDVPWTSNSHTTEGGNPQSDEGSVDGPTAPLPKTVLGGAALLTGLMVLRLRRTARAA